MKKLLLVTLTSAMLVACSSEAIKPSEVPSGSFDENTEELASVASDLDVATITFIQTVEDIEVDSIEATHKKMDDIEDVDGTLRQNIFLSFGTFEVDGQSYPFRSYISYTEDNFDSKFSGLYYTSEYSDKEVDVLPDTVDK